MSPERRAEIVKLLEESGEHFYATVASVPAAHVAVKPGPNRWSVLQIVEHVTLVEHGLMSRLQGAQPDPGAADNPEKEEKIKAGARNRTSRLESPERVRPTGRFPDVTHALQQLSAARDETIRFARETELDLFRISAEHPFFGPVSGYELLLIMAGHLRRHADQVGETSEALAQERA